MTPVWISLLHMSAYMSICLWVAFFAFKHKYIPKQFIVTAAFGFLALLYYLIFFLTLARPSVGLWANHILDAGGWIIGLYSIYRFRQLFKNKIILACVLLPLSIMVVLTIYYTALLTSCRLPSAASQKDDNLSYCYIHPLPGDNALPYLYAKNVITDKPHALISDWKLADRPPIQIGAAIGVIDLNNKMPASYRSYQLVATFLQLSWVAAVFGVLATFGLKLRQIILAIGAISLTGVIFINSVFVWPKFFAAGLVTMGCVLIFQYSSKNYKRELVTALAMIGLGTLIHDGVIFTILGVLAILGALFIQEQFIRKTRPVSRIPWRAVATGVAIALVLVVPWQIYKSSTTKSDRLLKWHLAGVVKVDNRSTTQTIIDSYKHIPFHTWVQNRKDNVTMLYKPIDSLDFSEGEKSIGFSGSATKQSLGHFAEWYQQNDFYIVMFAFGFFNVGWLTLLSHRNRSKISNLETKLLVATLIGIVLWVFVMFLPFSTVIHQGSYATMLIIFSLLATWLARSRLLLPVFVLQFLVFSIFWVFGIFAINNLSLHRGIPTFIETLLLLTMFLVTSKSLSKLPKKYYS